MLSTVPDALEAIRRGECIIVTDSEDRENEGDLIAAAELVTPEIINFMAVNGRGLICAPVTAKRAIELGLHDLSQGRQDRYGTAFTQSVDVKEGTSTGISAKDRSNTIFALVDEKKTALDFYVPGHVFPLIAVDGGVLERPGHTEASVDLARLAGLKPAGVICEIINNDGTMSRGTTLEKFAKEFDLHWITIEQIIEYRKEISDENEATPKASIRNYGHVSMPSVYSDHPFEIHGYISDIDGKEHVALVLGEVTDKEDVLIRIHSECLTGDVFGSGRCDCGEQLDQAMRQVVKAGAGVIVYLRQEGRGIGLINKIRAYSLQDQGYDTLDANLKLGFPADSRSYALAADILKDLGIKSVQLMTNNLDKVKGLEEEGIPVSKRVPIVIEPQKHNAHYLETKRNRFGHIL
ncbi:MAG: GTP cyclohydrolase II [Lentisphaeria bacterium]|nr:GTP cyclohydrolase II [Lentisphaeria bacterium]